MSIARLKRLQRLESRQPRGKPWVDPFPLCMRLWDAMQATAAAARADREFSRLPSQELSPEAEALLAIALKDSDRMAERLRAEAR